MRYGAVRFLLPALLIVLALWLQEGCLPLPASGHYQPDGRPSPEAAIGAGPKHPIHLGLTHIDDAFIELTQRVGGSWTSFDGLFMVKHGELRRSLTFWEVSADGRHFTLQYWVREHVWVMPLCFSIMPDESPNTLNLDVNDEGIVVGATTKTRAFSPATTPPARWLEVFDAPTRQKLRDAGVFPSDEELRDAQHRFESQDHQQLESPAATTSSTYK